MWYTPLKEMNQANGVASSQCNTLSKSAYVVALTWCYALYNPVFMKHKVNAALDATKVFHIILISISYFLQFAQICQFLPSPSLFISPVLGNCDFWTGVAWQTVSYSMAVRPIEEHPCVLRGKGSQIKYATKFLRAHLHAKPNISRISAKDKVWYDM